MAIHKYQAFVRVAEMGSITKAAEAMGYTQSAVSRMVADLEDEWNLNLLRRSRGGLALSSDGLMLLPYIKDLCSHYEALQEQANSLKGLETGFIRIGSCSSFSTQCLPSILKNFEQRYPRIVFQLQNMEYSETEEALCAGEIDCGFIAHRILRSLTLLYLCVTGCLPFCRRIIRWRMRRHIRSSASARSAS